MTDASSWIPVGSSSNATYQAVFALFARYAKTCAYPALATRTRTIKSCPVSTQETFLFLVRCRWRGGSNLQQGPTSVDVATELQHRPIGMCAKRSDGQLTAKKSGRRRRSVEGGATPSGSGRPAARSNISPCGDKTAAAAANRRVPRQGAHLLVWRPPRARRRRLRARGSSNLQQGSTSVDAATKRQRLRPIGACAKGSEG